MKLSFIWFPLGLLSLSAFAVPLPVETSIKEVGEGLKLPIELKLGNESFCWTGSGIRKKKVLVAKVKVYRLDSYLSCSAPLKDGEVTPESALKSKSWALKLTFLRDVTAEKVRSSFTEALAANAVDVHEEAPAKKLLDRIQTDLKEGNEVWIIGKKEAKEEKLEIALPGASLTANSATLASDFLKIWVGKTNESTMETLKAAIFSRRYVD